MAYRDGAQIAVCRIVGIALNMYLHWKVRVCLHGQAIFAAEVCTEVPAPLTRRVEVFSVNHYVRIRWTLDHNVAIDLIVLTEHAEL